ncbi:porin family protein [Belliella pelovolcani]|uniref:Outer membrane protein beta-barrel domain-containing protein n=1 Tax=Belliella pelovolcani TaxID=529505 RepID=A0A1N7NWZ8_9BACT|nr:porin family protein [Belliella pelovolcani]SIT02905.1 Outer membrane protein beta-barrel domain-containing protein [Belliella pelovolcani]
MKKSILLFAVLALFTFDINAQNYDRNDAIGGFGIRGGANFFNFGGSDASNNDYDNRVGFHGGLYANMFLGSRIALEPGVYYSIKGTQNDDFANSRAILNYVDVPLLLRLYLSDGLNVFGGPQASFLTGSRFEGDFFGSSFSYETDAITKTDLGFVVGIGYNLPKGLNIQGSYDYGTSPVFKDSDAAIYNRGFKLSLGYSF